MEEKIRNNIKPTKTESYISPEEKVLFDEIEKELFHEVSPGLFIEKKNCQPYIRMKRAIKPSLFMFMVFNNMPKR
ncbi:hypothetical protein [Alkaliphilus sp. B6464]|uniref:hypothetical protein n=1 Tax=Alkaliphilus sp. B6464 TaxID=2731219 RepID=UPI001BA90D48|nr:hypothetical protein [Alkaliphilus sp. B6464]QUH20584.1 hypothetical protein HYG84_12340 [Alkaliphilus sp. B6464]